MTQVSLEPMNDAQCEAFLEACLAPYIADRAEADFVSLAEAEQFARGQHARILPQGRLTVGHRFLRIMAGAEPVGGIWIYTDPQRREAFLYNIMIEPDRRRQGFATAALTAAEELLRSEGCRVLGLNVFATNAAALALYHRLGFRTASSYLNKQL